MGEYPDEAECSECTDRYTSRFKDNRCTEMCTGSEAGSYFRLIDIVSLNSRLESNKEERRRNVRYLARRDPVERYHL